jgi:peptidoglycan/LPS O-acetylase OafA/YrhL
MHHESQPFAVGFFVFRFIFFTRAMVKNAVAGKNPGSDGAAQTQFGLINLLKAGAAQLIVLHHLAFYGPMADHARPMMPALIDWLDSCARIAVQVFLVISGFLVAKSLSPQGRPGLDYPLATIWRRYAKLVPPFLVAMLLAVGASAWAATWMTHDSISAPPDMPQLGAHALLLHGVLDYESLSAGAWYVAIDFQLYAAMALLLWLSGRLAGKHPSPWLMPVVVAVAASTSLLYFNRDADWDVWAPYFFGSYGLGIMAWWASDPRRRPGAVALLLLMVLLPTLAALALDFRSRIAVAVVIACLLFLFGRARPTSTSYSGRGLSVLNGLGRISYSVFLVHFPVCLMVNAAFSRFVPAQPYLQAIGMLIGWAASLAAGAAFFRWVEAPLGRVLAFATEPVAIRPLTAKTVQP